MEEMGGVREGKGWGLSPLPNLNKSALNYRTEGFFVSLLLYEKTVPQHNLWFQKEAQLVAQAFQQLQQRRLQLPSLSTTYKLI